jgi:hypothetical protein
LAVSIPFWRSSSPGWIDAPTSSGSLAPTHHTEAHAGGPRQHPRRAWTEPRTLLVGLFVFTAAFTEGTGNDWLGIAVIDGYGAAHALGSLTFAVFLAAMALGRWSAGGCSTAGAGPTIRLLGAVALAGLVLVVFGGSLPAAIAGGELYIAEDPDLAAACQVASRVRFLTATHLIDPVP